MKKLNIKDNPALNSVLASIASIILGLIFGYIMLLIFKATKSGMGIRTILTTGITSLPKFAKVLYQSAPLMMTGLAVAFAFKTGLFNIGASGQYLMGTFFALFTGIVLKMPWWVALFAAMVGGAFWGFFPGLFKSLFNVNEVLTAIMFNWIGLFMVNMTASNIPKILDNYYGSTNSDRTAALANANPSAIIPRFGLDELFSSPYMNSSIFIVIIIAIIVWIILQKTKFGYELKACGFNQKAGLYAGINAKRNVVLSMCISGALAGIGGGIYYLSGNAQYTLDKVLLAMGFNGIPAALLGNSSPIGVIFSSLFISYIQVGGEALQPVYAKEIVDIIISSIIYLSALSVLMKDIIAKFLSGKKNKQAVK